MDGHAFIGEAPHCHPDDPTKPDCYSLGLRDQLIAHLDEIGSTWTPSVRIDVEEMLRGR